MLSFCCVTDKYLIESFAYLPNRVFILNGLIHFHFSYLLVFILLNVKFAYVLILSYLSKTFSNRVTLFRTMCLEQRVLILTHSRYSVKMCCIESIELINCSWLPLSFTEIC